MFKYAFPSYSKNEYGETEVNDYGMTLRDHFAALAMQGELASKSTDEGYYSEPSFKRLAENSYKIADAMMEARAR